MFKGIESRRSGFYPIPWPAGPCSPVFSAFPGSRVIEKFTDQEKENKNLKDLSFFGRINISGKKSNIVNKKLTLSNYYNADGVVRLVSMALMTLLGVEKQIS